MTSTLFEFYTAFLPVSKPDAFTISIRYLVQKYAVWDTPTSTPAILMSDFSAITFLELHSVK